MLLDMSSLPDPTLLNLEGRPTASLIFSKKFILAPTFHGRDLVILVTYSN